ncbi:MAG: hypothetical protein J0I77_02780 [Rudaea sp.]|uniref:hypothetical protein n=1 Tax=unclassified Rudaea TaxID=2627037 RepID=UPI0010F4E5A6|nr:MULTISPECIES: hypothetical protein [unclassified Rudaea]MBN8884623.1 hypothetical protein [Rudaea sp.]MBR0344814.1 hypothetical protein [Rudaea sp.]
MVFSLSTLRHRLLMHRLFAVLWLLLGASALLPQSAATKPAAAHSGHHAHVAHAAAHAHCHMQPASACNEDHAGAASCCSDGGSCTCSATCSLPIALTFQRLWIGYSAPETFASMGSPPVPTRGHGPPLRPPAA